MNAADPQENGRPPARAARMPDEERALYRRAIRDAVSLAAAGHTEEGYRVLDLGLAWAETPPYCPVSSRFLSPEPWAAELVRFYQRALVWYRQRLEHSVAALAALRQDEGPVAPHYQAAALTADSIALVRRAREIRAESTLLRGAYSDLALGSGCVRQASLLLGVRSNLLRDECDHLRRASLLERQRAGLVRTAADRAREQSERARSACLQAREQHRRAAASVGLTREARAVPPVGGGLDPRNEPPRRRQVPPVNSGPQLDRSLEPG